MKKKILSIAASIGILLALASCSSFEYISSDTSETTETKITSTDAKTKTNMTSGTKTTLEYEPEYVHYDVDINLTSDTTKKDVEDTVEDVYGSVVSIVASSSLEQSAGSGVLYTYSNEYNMSFIVTCFHVIEGADSFYVTYNNNTMDDSDDITYEAKLVGGNEDSDLAVLSIDEINLTYANIFSDSDSLKLGSSVVCIGNPLGTLPGSVSSGIISYVNRSIAVDDYSTMSLIQTDVAINSGNSGGGLFNTAGALIGIVNAKYSSTGIEGLGFAIPSNLVISTITELVNNASYDINNKIWSCGYVEGDFEFGFTISYYGGFNQAGSLYISSVEDNNTYSGTNLVTNYVISGLKIDYDNDSLTDIEYTIGNVYSSNDAISLMQKLYDAELKIGDKITFIYKNGNTISFEIIQFIYSI